MKLKKHLIIKNSFCKSNENSKNLKNRLIYIQQVLDIIRYERIEVVKELQYRQRNYRKAKMKHV